jgi:hypothetical protein
MDFTTRHRFLYNSRKRWISWKGVATVIQRAWRKHFIRIEKEDSLDRGVLQEVTKYIQDRASLTDLPTTPEGIGTAAVYFPSEIPSIVIKKPPLSYTADPLYGKSAITRLNLMKSSRRVCRQIRAKQLKIPKAGIIADLRHGELLIETKLPIKTLTVENIDLYVNHLEEFNEAVFEFFLFLTKTDSTDILTTDGHPDFYSDLLGISAGRYDNFSLYREEEKGVIGLIDLEHVIPTARGLTEEEKSKHLYHSCFKAITFFPYHFEMIMEVAKQFDPAIESMREELEHQRDNILQYFSGVYFAHAEFFQKKELMPENFAMPFEISLKQRMRLTEILESTFREYNGESLSDDTACKNI